MNEASANPLAPPLAGAKPPGEGWTLKRWLAVITIIFAAHVLLIFCFGERKKIVPRPVANVPTLQFAGKPDELLALENPALFALPNPKDFASAVWLKMPDIPPPFFGWTEPPRWLALAPENLGATFHSFMQTNYFAGYSFQFKPPPKFTEPPLPAPLALPQNSIMRVTGALAKRKLLQQLHPPSLPYNDVLPPSIVQALVDATGNVVSVVLLSPSGLDAADQRALAVARTARFAPAPRLTLGQLIFNWQTIPTNAPAASP